MEGYELSAKVLWTITGVPLAALCRGYVLSLIWAWFVVPVFHLPLLTIPYALGISLLVGFLTMREDQNGEGFFVGLGAAVLQPWIVLLFAWVVRWFV